MKKRCLAVLLALALCVALFPASTLAAESDFTIEDGVLTKYNGSGGDVVIPDGVTSIGDRAFYYCTGLTSVTIPSSVTSIGEWAFWDCTSLTSVTIPDSVTSIGGKAFAQCTSLTSVTIPSSVTTIGMCAFQLCTGLTGVTIPSSVTEIGSNAFSGCTSLTDVTIPDAVTDISNGAFYGCTSLTSVTIPNGVTSIGASAFYGCTGLTGVTIPSSVTSIGGYAFEGCTGLTSVIIPDGVTSIGQEAFFLCNSLASVTIPSSVTGIGYYAFAGCVGLTDVYYGGSEADWGQIKIDTGNYGNDILLRATIHYNSPMPEAPAGPTLPTLPTVENIPASGTAVETKQTIMLDGAAKEFQCYAIMDANGNGTNYIKIRDLADALNGTGAQFNVGWDGKISIQSNTAYQSNGSENSIAYTGDQAYESISSIAISFNGQDINLTAINIQGGNTYYKLRDLGQLLNFNVKWDAEAGQVAIESNQPYNPND